MRPRFTYTFNNSGDKYPYDNDEILLRVGAWTIRRVPFVTSEWESYIHHKVEKNIVQQNPWVNGQRPDPLTYLKKIGCEWSDLPMGDNRCTNCLDTIPESIMALWTMHNWAYLQKYDKDMEKYATYAEDDPMATSDLKVYS